LSGVCVVGVVCLWLGQPEPAQAKPPKKTLRGPPHEGKPPGATRGASEWFCPEMRIV